MINVELLKAICETPGAPGFAFPDDKGNWKGLDVDYCRAVASAGTSHSDATVERDTGDGRCARFEQLHATSHSSRTPVFPPE